MNRLRPAINPQPCGVIPVWILFFSVIAVVSFLAALDYAMPGKSFASHVTAAIWSASQ